MIYGTLQFSILISLKVPDKTQEKQCNLVLKKCQTKVAREIQNWIETATEHQRNLGFHLEGVAATGLGQMVMPL